MSQADKSKGTSLRKGAKKGEGRELETRVAEAADPRDPAQKQAVDHHSEFQKLTQRAAELEAQVGELAELRRRMEETQGELKKLQEDRDRSRTDAGKARIRAADLERRLQEMSVQGSRATALEKEAAGLRVQIEDAQKELRKAKSDAAAAASRSPQIEESRKALEKTQAERDEANARAAQAAAKLEEQERGASGLRRQVDDLQKELKKAQEELKASVRSPELDKKTQEESAALRKQADEAREAARRIQAERDQIKSKAEEQEKGSAGLRRQVDDLQKELKKVQEERDRAKAAVRPPELEKKAQEDSLALRKQVEESRETVRRLQVERDQTKEKADKALARAEEQERGAAGLSEAAAALRRRLEESRVELKKLQESRDKNEQRAVKAESRAGELERRVLDLTAQSSKLPGLSEELAAARAELKMTQEQRARAEAKAAEDGRYFASLEKELMDAQESEAKAREEAAAAVQLRAAGDRLLAENRKLEDAKRELQGKLEKLARTMGDQERKLREAEAAKAPAPPPAPPPPPPARAAAPIPAPPPPAKEVHSSPLDSLFDSVPADPAPTVEEKPAEPRVEAPVKEAPIDSIFDPEPPSPPPPAPVAASIPASQPVPGSASSDTTTLRPQHTFGPMGEDGQPKYILHELLPPDAMGVVYRASERATNRQFAVRFLSGQAGEEQTQAIEREVEKLIALPHPNILHVQGSGRRKNRLYLAMDLVQGPTLGRAKIHDLRRVCAIIRDIAGAVHYAHEEKILHGDLNPDNIIVARGEDGGDHALVKDFAVGFLLEALIVPATSKEARTMLRNLAYLPPEQMNEAKPKLSVAGDVYGLGATLYGALAARPPFEGRDAAQLKTRVMFAEPVALSKVRPDVPEAVATIVRRAMVKESGLRTRSAHEMAEALTKYLDSSGG